MSGDETVDEQASETLAETVGQNSDATIPRLLIHLWAVLVSRIYEVSPLVCPH